MKEQSESYKRGYRNGRCDRNLNIPALQTALHNPDKDYADGYRCGYFSKLVVEPYYEDN